mgnify:CR=1 FL=1
MNKRMALETALFVGIGSVAWIGGGCARPVPSAQTLQTPGPETLEQRDARMQWWREARFGLFIHWGPVSLKGTEIGWSRGGERRGRENPEGGIPVEIYDNLYKQFNPVKFNADEWVRIAKDAGMKYLVFTTKHHDGFVNFDSKYTDYKITSRESPFRRDIVRELADACRRGGLRLGFYYSQPDWHHPDYRTENHARYLEYLHNQLRELCTNYGKVDIIWFDGLGGTAKDWDAENLCAMIRRLQPGVLINNRCGLPGDFETPEQRVGSFQKEPPWETCMTIGQQWAWKPDDKIKSTRECIQTLVRAVGGDGNFLFNVGPMPDGRIEPTQVARLREMGEWLRKYGHSVYGTRGGPFRWNQCERAAYVATCRDDLVYVHILEWPTDRLTLPPLSRGVIDATLLTGGQATVRQTEKGITVSVPAAYRQEIDTILVLKLDGPAGTITPVAAGSDSLARRRPAKASGHFNNLAEFGPDKAFDDDMGTRWAADAGTKQAWLEVDLGKPCLVGRAVISEAFGKRVQEFELQCRQDGQWKVLHRGEKLGDCATLQFAPVTAQEFRLNILKATDGPTIWEFRLFAPDDKPGE